MNMRSISRCRLFLSKATTANQSKDATSFNQWKSMPLHWPRLDTEASAVSEQQNQHNQNNNQNNNNHHHKEQQNGIADYSDLILTFDVSPVEKVMVRNKSLFLKRDDLLRLSDSHLSGNKARKLFYLNQLSCEEFPKVLVSYGGPQSNAMMALAALVNSKQQQLQQQLQLQLQQQLQSQSQSQSESLPWQDLPFSKFRFVYYTKKLPRWLRNTPSGNFLRALSLGMELVELSPPQYNDLFGGHDGGSVVPPWNLDPPPNSCGEAVWIPQGGATDVALPGVTQLAMEIVEFWKCQTKSDVRKERKRKLAVCIPGGTCTTALFLQRAIATLLQPQQQSQQHLDISVVVIPCVGDAAYAARQMMSLHKTTRSTTTTTQQGEEDHSHNSHSFLPHILEPKPSSSSSSSSSSFNQNNKNKNNYYTFGQPHPDIWNTYQEMKEEYNVNLDLLYGASAWTILLQHWDNPHPKSPIFGREIMYVHSGGLEGNASQMTRYKQKGLIPLESVM